MYVSDLALNDFRSYRELVVQLPAGVVVLVGRNGRGKTNLVEALGYLSTFSSHRVSADKALVRQAGEDEEAPTAAVIRAKVNYQERSRLMELEIVQGKANRARLNRSHVAPRELLGNLRTVTFAPEDLQLLRGDPAGRRRFVDDMVLQLKPSFAAAKRDLERVLRQRAAVLKQLARTYRPEPSAIDDALGVWDEALAKVSSEIVAHRVSALDSLRPLMIDRYRQVSDDDKVSALRYGSKLVEQEQRYDQGAAGQLFADAEIPLVEDGYFRDLAAASQILIPRYLAMIQLQREQEVRRGVNLVGAQRDDVEISLQHMPVKGYASHGETWSIVLSLRLAQMSLLTAEGATPLLILDDVFAELDSGRRRALVEAIGGVEQVIITAAVGEDIPVSLGATRFSVTWDAVAGSAVAKSDGEDDGTGE